MPYDSDTGKRKRGRPSFTERFERPDLFEPLPRTFDVRKLVKLPVDPTTGRRRRGRPTREEHEERLRLIAEMESRQTQQGAPPSQTSSLLALDRNPFEQIAFTSITGLKEREYESILVAQDGRCAVCMTKAIVKPASLCNGLIPDIDQRGVVRGLLCPACHAALNLLNQDPGLVQRVASYMNMGDAVRILSDFNTEDELPG